jgi:hypothetical protein
MNHLANACSLDHVSSNGIMISGQFWNGRGKIGRDLFEVTFRHLLGGKWKNYNSQIPTRNSKRASSE